VGDVSLGHILIKQPSTFNAKRSFFTFGRIVNPRVNHLAIPTTGAMAKAVFGFEENYAAIRPKLLAKPFSYGKANNTAADDDVVKRIDGGGLYGAIKNSV
jgi:hypothetical protein